MSPSSTSSSEAIAAAPEPAILSRFKPREAEIIPDCPAPLWRWGTVVFVLLVAEWLAGVVVELRVVEKPVLYGLEHMDEKRAMFLNEYLPAQEPGRRFLVMGTSIPHTNVAPDVVARALEERTGQPWTGFNGALYGIRYADMLFFLDWYHEHWKFDEIIILVDPWGMRFGRMPNLQERLSKPAFEQWMTANSNLMRIRGQWRPWRVDRDDEIRGKIALDILDTKYGWSRTIMALAPNQGDIHVVAESQAKQMIFQNEKGPVGPHELQLDLVEQFRDWGVEHGINIWWVIPVYSTVLEEYMLPEFRHDAMKRLIAGLIEGVPGNYLFDMSDVQDTFDPKTDYFDGNHLSPTGALRFSELLGERWAIELQRRGQVEAK